MNSFAKGALGFIVTGLAVSIARLSYLKGRNDVIREINNNGWHICVDVDSEAEFEEK